MKIKDLPDNTPLNKVKVVIPNPEEKNLPIKPYYYIHSLTGSTAWIKIKNDSNPNRVYPISMISQEWILNLNIFNEK